MTQARTWTETVAILLLLVALTLAVYGQAGGFGFVNLDDPRYVSDNARVLAGPTLEGLAWAFTSYEAAAWQPLTWLSLMVDAAIAGPEPGAYHATNVALHLANTLLLFALLTWTTGSCWGGGLVAALFAVHPLHVESVAWITERKDVLSTLFWMLTMLAWVHHVRRPSTGRYAAVVAVLAAGLMAKPMLVTLPLVLMLFDHWPLGRFDGTGHLGLPRVTLRRAALEKLPLLSLSAAASWIAIQAQKSGGALGGLDTLPLGARLGNAVVSYVAYLVDMVWPTGLAVMVPHPREGLPSWQILGSTTILLGLTLSLVLGGRRRRYLAVGWLWYVLTLLPVIGLVQIGVQARADRFTYVPLIGPFLILGWMALEIAGRGPAARRAVAASGAGAVLVLALLAHAQAGHWRDSESLYRHALRVNDANARAHNGLGIALTEDGANDRALQHFRRAVALDPTYAEAQANLASALVLDGRPAEAEPHFLSSLGMQPDNADVRRNYGTLLLQAGRDDDALEQFTEAVRLDPQDASAHNNLGVLLLRRGEPERAAAQFREALRIDPSREGTRRNLERLEHAGGRTGADPNEQVRQPAVRP